MPYLFYLGETQLPVTPGKLQLKISGNNKTVTLINEGEINILKETGLTEINFEALIPQSRYPFAVTPDGYKTASNYLAVFEQLKASKIPFQFVVSRTKPTGDYLFDTNIKVSLEEYTIIEDAAGNGMDLNVSIRLKQYKEYSTKTLDIKKISSSTSATSTSTSNNKSQSTNKAVASVNKARASGKVTATSHKVKSGETLWGICKKEFNDGSKYLEIAKQNGISDPNKIKPGMVIKFG